MGMRKYLDIPLTVVVTTVLTVAMLWPLEAPPPAPEESDKLLHFIAFPLARTGRFGVIPVLIGAERLWRHYLADTAQLQPQRRPERLDRRYARRAYRNWPWLSVSARQAAPVLRDACPPKVCSKLIRNLSYGVGSRHERSLPEIHLQSHNQSAVPLSVRRSRCPAGLEC